jgi:hypothetical protein
MNTNPAVAGFILKTFAIITVTALGAVCASDKIIGIASRKQMGVRGQKGLYNARVHPEQDPLYEPLFISSGLTSLERVGDD